MCKSNSQGNVFCVHMCVLVYSVPDCWTLLCCKYICIHTTHSACVCTSGSLQCTFEPCTQHVNMRIKKSIFQLALHKQRADSIGFVSLPSPSECVAKVISSSTHKLSTVTKHKVVYKNSALVLHINCDPARRAWLTPVSVLMLGLHYLMMGWALLDSSSSSVKDGGCGLKVWYLYPCLWCLFCYDGWVAEVVLCPGEERKSVCLWNRNSSFHYSGLSECFSVYNLLKLWVHTEGSFHMHQP